MEPVTFLLTAYNQPDYIEDAVESALAQTYPDLRIVISDDCSTDDTPLKIEVLLAVTHDNPPHVTFLNNPSNVGIGHVRDLLKAVNTRYVVLGHGDDVFAPDRVEKQIARLSEKKLGAVACNPVVIDADSNEIGRYFRPDALPVPTLEEVCVRGRNPAQLGAMLAWDMSLFRNFPEPLPQTRRIDQIVSFRALLQGGLEIMPEPLIKLRRHGKNRSPVVQLAGADDDLKRWPIEERRLWSRIGHAHFMLNDLTWWQKHHPNDPRSAEISVCREALTRRIVKESEEWAALRYKMARAGIIEH